MTNPVQDIYDDMMTRCEGVTIMTRLAGGEPDGPVAAEGILVLDDCSGTLLALEVGIDEQGVGSVSVRSFGRDAKPQQASIVQVGDSVLIHTR